MSVCISFTFLTKHKKSSRSGRLKYTSKKDTTNTHFLYVSIIYKTQKCRLQGTRKIRTKFFQTSWEARTKKVQGAVVDSRDLWTSRQKTLEIKEKKKKMTRHAESGAQNDTETSEKISISWYETSGILSMVSSLIFNLLKLDRQHGMNWKKCEDTNGEVFQTTFAKVGCNLETF